MHTKLFTKRRVLLGFFITLFLIGFASFRSYGISWDEPNMYNLGSEAYASAMHGAAWVEVRARRYHGPTFEILLHGVEVLLGLQDPRAIFFMRHLVNFFAFIGGVATLYALATKFFSSWKWGILTATLLVLSPRIFGDAFFNSRDIPMLALFTLAIFTLLRMLDRPSWGRIAMHAFACALAVTIRMPGVFLIAITLGFLVLNSVLYRAVPIRSTLLHATGFLLLWATMTVLLWPLLWDDPLQNFMTAFSFMSSHGSSGLYMGGFDPGHWHYLPVWIAITTPVVYTVFLLVGLAMYLLQFAYAPVHFLRTQRHRLIALCWLFGPIASVVILHSGVYDGWRHLFFVYPALLLIAVDGLRATLRTIAHRCASPYRMFAMWGVTGSLALSLLSTSLWMVRNHPYQNLYFSLPSHFIAGNFELDYWGLTFREGLEFVLAHDRSPVIAVHPTSSPGYSSNFLLKPEDRRRIAFTDDEHAKYILDNFRRDHYEKRYEGKLPKVYSITIDGIEHLAVYRNAPKVAMGVGE